LNVLFVDPSLRSTGIYALQAGATISETFKTDQDHIEALGAIARYFSDPAKWYDALVIEDYAFSRASQSVSKNAEVGGIIRGWFAYYKKPVVEVGISTWKSICGIKLKKDTAKAKKAYIDEAFRRYGIHFDSTDAVDAYLIFYACKQILDHKVKETEAMTRLWVRLKAAGIDTL